MMAKQVAANPKSSTQILTFILLLFVNEISKRGCRGQVAGYLRVWGSNPGGHLQATHGLVSIKRPTSGNLRMSMLLAIGYEL